ncbi:hypothetical protein [Streptomyces purpurascens]
MVSQNEGFTASARGAGEPWAVWRDGDLGDDPAGAYEASVDEVTAAFAEDDALERRFALPEVGEGFAVPDGRRSASICSTTWCTPGTSR